MASSTENFLHEKGKAFKSLRSMTRRPMFMLDIDSEDIRTAVTGGGFDVGKC